VRQDLPHAPAYVDGGAAALMRAVWPVPFAIAALLSLAGCSAGVLAICTSAGGTYAAGTCTRWSAGQQAAEQQCESHGGVYLGGQDICVVGAGGP
jgi:hypothetical protein